MTKEPIIRKDLDEVLYRTDSMALGTRRLIAVGAAAMAARGRASALHPANSPGIFSYHDGVEALRAEFIGRDGWSKYARGGLEGIVNEDLKLIVLFKNVDQCCMDFHTPQAAPVGANSERICGAAPLFDHAGTELPEITYIPEPEGSNLRTSRFSVFYLMMDPLGRLELSVPVFIDKVIDHCLERIYLIEDGDLDAPGELPEEPVHDEDEFVIDVKRKNEV